MIADVLTVLKKELKEVLSEGGGRGKLNLLILVGVFGVFIPLQSGRAWIEQPGNMLMWLWVPIFLVVNVIADAFAGERERHTLETLLASRLSDRAILFGKMAAAVAYGCGIALTSMVVGVVVINVTAWDGQLLLYPLPVALGLALLMLLGCTLMASLGALVSLRAASMKQAAQTLMVVILLVFLPLSFGTMLLPEQLRTQVFLAIMNADIAAIALIAGAVLMVVNTLLIAAAMARFKRARLILD